MTATDKRRDGRSATQLRGKELRLAYTAFSDGSAWYGHGQSSVIAVVDGPLAARPEQEDYRRCLLDVRVARTAGIPTAGGASRGLVQVERSQRENSDTVLAASVAKCLEAVVLVEQFPRCVIQVTVEVLKDDGSLFSVVVNAVMCALLDAGIPCRTTIAAVSMLVVPTAAPLVSASSKLQFLLDPTAEEEQHTGDSVAIAHLAFAWNGSGIVASSIKALPHKGSSSSSSLGLTLSDIALVESVGERAAKTVFEFFRNCAAPLAPEETVGSF